MQKKPMIAFRQMRPSPIGLHLTERTATLVQVTGQPGQREVYAIAKGEVPCNDNLPPEEQDQAVAAALKKLVADHHFKGRQVVSCLGSQELFVQNVRLPQLPPEEVEKVVRWEAEERLPYTIDEAEIRHLPAGQVRQDANVKQEVILLACHSGVINRQTNLLERAGLIPVAVDVEPCAVLRCLRTCGNEPSGRRQAYLNLGEQATTVIFAEDDQILFLKYVGIGGHHFDQAVARHLELGIEEAATLRASVTAAPTLNTENEIHRSVIDAIRNGLETLASEVELCIRYYTVTFRGRPLERIAVTGSEANPWLATYLTDRLGQQCEMKDPFETLDHRPTSATARECPGQWTTALGLALK